MAPVAPFRSRFSRSCADSGFTLIELIITIIILSIVALVVVGKSDGVNENARFKATLQEMDQLAESIRGSENIKSGGVRTDFGYVGDVGALPSSLNDLLSNPGGYSTWRGPYVNEVGGGDALADGWGQAYIYTGGLSIVSNGSGASITKALADNLTDLTGNTVSGIVRDAGKLPPGAIYKDSVTALLQYPDGSGGMTTVSATPNATGSFSFSGVPIGNHRLLAVNNTGVDTVELTISVLPHSEITSILQFGVSLW